MMALCWVAFCFLMCVRHFVVASFSKDDEIKSSVPRQGVIVMAMIFMAMHAHVFLTLWGTP